jgi:hypothetical protein
LKNLAEVWAGRAWAGANEVEFTKMSKCGGRRKKNGDSCVAGERPLVARRPWFSEPWSATSGIHQLATSGQGLVDAGQPAPDRWSLTRGLTALAGCGSQSNTNCGWAPFPIFFSYLTKIFGLFGDGPSILGEWVYNTPIF